LSLDYKFEIKDKQLYRWETVGNFMDYLRKAF